MSTVIDLFKIMDDDTNVVIRSPLNEIIFVGKVDEVFQQMTIGQLLTLVTDLYFSTTYNAISLQLEDNV